jgi:serralysin
LLGAGGADLLFGRDGADTLDGGDGQDLLAGGTGDDVLFGGDGADVFVFEDGHDVIRDFTDDLDDIQIAASMWGGGARTVAEILDPGNVTLTATGLQIWLAPGHMLDLDGVFDVGVLYDDISII